MGGVVIGIDQHHWLLHALAGTAHLLHQNSHAGETERTTVDLILALGSDCHHNLVAALLLLLGIGGWQVDLQFSKFRVGGSEHQKNDDHHHDIDHRDHIHLRVLAVGASPAKIHWLLPRPAPCVKSTRREAARSISTTKPSTAPRK